MSQTAPPKSQPASTYEVARAKGQCILCQSEILPLTPIMAALRETPLGFERQDICLNCWPTADKSNLVASWRTHVPHHEQKKKLFVDDQVLCELFERLQDTPEPAKQNFRFVLGLILMRKRLIIYETTRTEGENEFWEVRFKGKEARMSLLNPKLDEQQMQDVSTQLGEILNEEI